MQENVLEMNEYVVQLNKGKFCPFSFGLILFVFELSLSIFLKGIKLFVINIPLVFLRIWYFSCNEQVKKFEEVKYH